MSEHARPVCSSLWLQLGCTNEAIADYSRVLELDPDSFNATYARAGKEKERGGKWVV